MQYNRVDTTANRLKTALDESGLRQVDLVRETGIDKGALSSYLKGRYEPKQDGIYKLALALNVSEMWLWGYDCPKHRTAEQQNNDTISDAVVTMRSNPVFLASVKNLLPLTDDQLAVINQMALALQQKLEDKVE